MTDRFRDRLSEYLDGDLASSEEALVRRHLEDCAECSSTLADLEAVSKAAARLGDRAPENDLWAGIAERIEAEHMEAERIEDDAGQPGKVTSMAGVRAGRFARRISLTIPQLAAAAVALTTISTAGAWIALGGGESSAAATRGDGSPIDGSRGAALVSTQGAESAGRLAEQYGSVISELEDALFDRANSLPPETEISLRRALLKIDRAIEDAEKALESLPGDAYLERHVEATMRRKTEFLRRAVRLSQS